MVQLLFENGAAIDAQDDQGRTPLHYAAMNSHGEIAKYLISNNADHMLENNEGLKGCEVAPKPLDKELTDFVICYLLTKSHGIQLSSSNVGICVFCQQKEADFVFKPCEHVSLCAKCYEENKDKLHFCPMCRKTLQSVVEIKKEDKQE